ncbi:hypothetical protein HKCCE2091_05010 [Rhodobacterales bacterium HKCCE2091]|nr:hypothetical protein [Rhodobacterales bacterium HKCCE2091]
MRHVPIPAAMLAATLAALPATAQEDTDLPRFASEEPPIYALFEAAGIYERVEWFWLGELRNAERRATSYLGAKPDPEWAGEVERIFETERLVAAFEDAFDTDALSADEIAELETFYRSGIGQQVREGEIAMLRDSYRTGDGGDWDAALEEASAGPAPWFDQLSDALRASGRIDLQTTYRLNAEIAFNQGLADAGGEAGASYITDALEAVGDREAQFEAFLGTQILTLRELDDAEMSALLRDPAITLRDRLTNATYFAHSRVNEEVLHDLAGITVAAAAR